MAFRPPGGEPKPADREPLKGTNSLLMPLFPWHPDQRLIQRRIQGTYVASMPLEEVGTYWKPLFRDGASASPMAQEGREKDKEEGSRLRPR